MEGSWRAQTGPPYPLTARQIERHALGRVLDLLDHVAVIFDDDRHISAPVLAIAHALFERAVTCRAPGPDSIGIGVVIAQDYAVHRGAAAVPAEPGVWLTPQGDSNMRVEPGGIEPPCRNSQQAASTRVVVI